jgi:putative oxidoreductase
MSVAAFVYHAGDSFEVREKALLYLFISLFYAIKGPGRVSVDRWIKGA